MQEAQTEVLWALHGGGSLGLLHGAAKACCTVPQTPSCVGRWAAPLCRMQGPQVLETSSPRRRQQSCRAAPQRFVCMVSDLIRHTPGAVALRGW